MTIKRAISIVGVATAIFSLAQFANADSLQTYCNKFDDIWFTTMTFASGYCYPGTWGNITVTRADATFGASLSVGLIGEGESIEQMDEQFKTDFSGRNIPFPVNRDLENVHEEFGVASFGSFATRKSLNTWQVVFDNNGKELGHRQDVSITYIIRQGRCYATLGVSGEGPLDSPFYYGILSDNAKKEAGVVTNTMKNMGICGGSSDTPLGAETGLVPLPVLQPTGEEEKKIISVEPAPEIPIQTTVPNTDTDGSNEKIRIKEIKKCFAPLKIIDGENGCEIDLNELFKTPPADLINTVIPEKIDVDEFIIDEDAMAEYQAKFKKYSRLAVELENVLMSPSETITATYAVMPPPERSYGSYSPLVVLDADGFSSYVTVGGTAVEKITKDLELPSQSAIITGDDGKVVVGERTSKTVMEINPKSIVVAGWSAEDTMPAAQDLVGALQNFSDFTIRSGSVNVAKEGDSPGVKIKTPLTTTVSKHTRFKVSYDPEEQFAITTIYEGEVKVTDVAGNTTTLALREDGKPRALVTLGEQSNEKNILSFPLWIFLAVCSFAGIGFAVWRKIHHK